MTSSAEHPQTPGASVSAAGPRVGAGPVPAAAHVVSLHPEDEQIPEPPSTAADWLHFELDDLARVRALVTGSAASARLDEQRATDLVLAVNEVATNSIRHAGGSGRLRVWRSRNWLICEVTDPGHLTDTQAGRLLAPASRERGRGLWLVGQLCDLVHITSSAAGTTVRVQMDLGKEAAGEASRGGAVRGE